MKLTYDEILNSMKKTFYEQTGENVDLLGDLGARFQAVASELYSLACNCDYNFRQSWPQTATGEYLEKHATLRGTARKQGAKAKVILSFGVSQPAEEELVIPEKTICACKEKPFVQFETNASAVIPIGESSVDVEATALAEGRAYNVGKGEITVMVNPPMGVSSVVNKGSANGGCDTESDERLRKRIINSYSVPSTGLTETSMATVLEQLDEIMECRIMQDEGILNVYVRTADSTVSQELEQKITRNLAIAKILSFELKIYSVSPASIGIGARCKISSNAPSDTVDKLKKLITDYVDSARIGETIELYPIEEKCIKLEGIEQIKLSTPNSENGVIPILNNQYPQLDSLEVELYD